MKKFKKFLLLPIFTLIFLILSNFSSAATKQELEAQINTLVVQIKQLQIQLSKLQHQQNNWCHNFNVDLKIGDKGDEVEALE